MATFQERTQACMEKGNLRLADVARWFDRRHSTTRGWVVDGREPAGTPADAMCLFERLGKLEEFIRKGMSGRELRAHIQSKPAKREARQ